jgi:hypothetical protein
MKKRTVAELAEALERANERITRDSWFIRSLYPEPGWSVLISPRAYQILLVHVMNEGDELQNTRVDYIDTLASNWNLIRIELLPQVTDNGTTIEHDQLCEALEDVSRAHAAANIPKNAEGSR